MYDIIKKKRDGNALSDEEIRFFVDGYVAGTIPDYQVSALLMAIYFQGLTKEEGVTLTLCMRDSGEVLDLSAICGIKIDKHSSGGVGDKTSIALAPMVAACGGCVAKMSGRGLGHTGGTIDKLESIPGFSTSLEVDAFINQVNRINIAIMGQTKELAPADKLLYALRDVTATVENKGLIASSIMSKKLASGADAIVLDVTVGSGAFMKKEEDALELAREMVSIGNGAGKKTMAVLTNMDEPLGYAVGNSLEVIEAIETLRGNGPEDFVEICLTLGAYMLLAGDIYSDYEAARQALIESIESGTALEKLKEFVAAQGGDPTYIDNPKQFELGSICREVVLRDTGYVKSIQAEEVGMCSLILGGGRETKEESIDASVGLVLHKKVGDFVAEGESIATIYGNDEAKVKAATDRLMKAYKLDGNEVAKPKLILGAITQ